MNQIDDPKDMEVIELKELNDKDVIQMTEGKKKKVPQKRFNFSSKLRQFNSRLAEMVFSMLFIWSLIELFLCLFVLSTHPSKTYEKNTLDGICEGNECNGFIDKALYFRICSAALLLIGCFPVSYIRSIRPLFHH